MWKKCQTHSLLFKPNVLVSEKWLIEAVGDSFWTGFFGKQELRQSLILRSLLEPKAGDDVWALLRLLQLRLDQRQQSERTHRHTETESPFS